MSIPSMVIPGAGVTVCWGAVILASIDAPQAVQTGAFCLLAVFWALNVGVGLFGPSPLPERINLTWRPASRPARSATSSSDSSTTLLPSPTITD